MVTAGLSSEARQVLDSLPLLRLQDLHRIMLEAMAVRAEGLGRLASDRIRARDYRDGCRWIEAGLAYASGRDLEPFRLHLFAWRARLRLETGHWRQAEGDALAVLASPCASAAARLLALTTLGLLQARQRKPDAAKLLDEALVLALAASASALSGAELQPLASVHAARAEFALLHGRFEAAHAEADAGLVLLAEVESFWEWENLRYLKWRADSGRRAPHAGFDTHDLTCGPHTVLMRGDWRGAADSWAHLGCPYERADALADGDLPALEEALAIFTELGAAPAADRVRRDLRRVGLTHLRRGPRRSTRAHPAGLTCRESEILGLLARQLSNPAIGERLCVSPKTVEHHVSAILGKLAVTTRAEAVLKARHSGWLLDRRAKLTETDSAAGS